MEEALLVPNIRMFSEHKVQAVDFHRRIMSVHDAVANTTKQVEFDLCIGADGSHSIVRRQLMRVTRYVFWVPNVALSSCTSDISPLRTVEIMGSCHSASLFIFVPATQDGLPARVYSP